MMKFLHEINSGRFNPLGFITDLSKGRMDRNGTILSRIPMQRFFEHMIVFGTSGSGKSNIYELLAKRFLPQAIEGKLTLICVDSSVFPNRVARYIDKNLKSLDSKNVYLFDPQRGKGGSTDHYIQTNIFDLPGRIKEMVTPEYIEGMYEEIFAALLDNPLSDQMKELFSYCVQLMEATGKPSVKMLRDIIVDPESVLYSVEIDREVLDFFEREIVPEKNRFTQTKRYIVGRLNVILKSPTMRHMLCSENPRMNIYDVVLNGGVFLFATRTIGVNEALAKTLGRIGLMLCGQISQMKAIVDGVPSILLVDEAADYGVNGDIKSLRTSYKKDRKNQDCRAIAAQQPSDFSDSFFKTATNCSAIKACGRMENDEDAAKLAKVMRVKADEIMGLQDGQFFVRVRGMHDKGIIVDIPPGSLGKWKNDAQQEKMKAEAIESTNKLRAIMAKRYGSKVPDRRKPSQRRKLKQRRAA